MKQYFFKNTIKESMNQRFLYAAELSFKYQGDRKTVVSIQELKELCINQPFLINLEKELYPTDD